MAIYQECPAMGCHRKQSLENETCKKCGRDLEKSRRKNKVNFWVYARYRGSQTWERVGRSLTAARLREKTLMAEIIKEEYTPTHRTSRLKVFFENEYLPHAKRTKRSWDKDEQRFGKYLLPFFGDCKLTSIKPGDIERFKETRLSQKTRLKANARPASVNRDLALLRRVFNLAKRWGKHRGDNPVAICGLLPEDNAHIAKFLSREQARSLLEALPTGTKPIFEFAMASGFRISNILELRWDQIDNESRLVALPRTKSGRPLRMPLNDWMLDILERVPRRLGSPYVFARLDNGKPYADIHRGFKAALVDAGLDPKTRIHDLRHSYASWAAASGVPTSVLRDLLGHSTLAMVGRYAHAGHETLVEMSNRVTSPFEKDANHIANTGS